MEKFTIGVSQQMNGKRTQVMDTAGRELGSDFREPSSSHYWFQCFWKFVLNTVNFINLSKSLVTKISDI